MFTSVQSYYGVTIQENIHFSNSVLSWPILHPETPTCIIYYAVFSMALLVSFLPPFEGFSHQRKDLLRSL